MNPPCFVCGQSSSRVCVHPHCTSPPYFCSGSCNKNLSQKLHTHSQIITSIPFSFFQQQINKIKQTLDPSKYYSQHQDKLRKKTVVVKAYLEHQIFKLDEILKQHERDILSLHQLKLTKESGEINNKIKRDKIGQTLSGKELYKLIKNQNRYIKTSTDFNKIDYLENQFLQSLNKLQQFNISQFFISNKQILDSEEQYSYLFKQGEKLRENNQFELALKKFQKARELNNIDFQVHLEIGYCFLALNNFEQSKKSFKKSLKLKADNPEALNNIGILYRNKKSYDEGIKYYNEAIRFDNQDDLFWKNRAEAYVSLKNIKKLWQIMSAQGN